MRVTSKIEMYRLLSRGAFGNTVPQYFSVDEWKASADRVYPSWGVRSARVAGHSACRLYTPTEEVADYSAKHFGDGVNISPMIDAVAHVTAMLHVVDIDGRGLVVDGVVDPARHANWRHEMGSPRRRQFEGVAARLVLERYLNANSLDDLRAVLDLFPGAVVELSTVDRCVGTVPLRNAVVWEVRHY